MNLDKFFGISERGSTVGREVLAGLTTFLAMSYILFVNPAILTGGFQVALQAAFHMSAQQVQQTYGPLLSSVQLSFTIATALAAGFATLVMALYARMPFGLAPGMGENAFIGYTIIPAFLSVLLHQKLVPIADAPLFAIYLALVSVFFNGILFLIFSIGGIREFIINSVPESIKLGISIGIGLFISLIGLANIGLVTAGQGTPITINWQAFTSATLYLGIASAIIAGALLAFRVPGAFLIAIIATTLAGLPLGLVSPPPYTPTYNLTTSILNNLPGSFYLYFALFGIGFPIAFSLFLVDFFDGLGTITGLAMKAGLVRNGKIVNLNRALISDSLASIFAPFFGTSTTVVYIESATGIEQGGRTGLTALVISLLFFSSIALAPLFAAVPAYATGGVLTLVGLLFLGMAGRLVAIDDYTETIPAFMAIMGIPFTFSITAGIGLGFIFYVLLKAATGRFRDLKPGIVLIAILFAIYFGLTTYFETTGY
ncbi:NCS2 family permease [Thermoproteus tenax]|uniref:Xanthine/uracil permease family n=1 Tax=Thermoproteus tenax (strain ATCC 35583 / DSM 2078 / JCM 9277 / NBRC 100435 / Kra 1) TaxID=768679 RepID=G4RLK5_THETK|nr:NCS2 family permease [Thermoproteus tenax]CCC82450.1 xanthine/uracil permease family [Thermoproteus tenax Kra 1]